MDRILEFVSENVFVLSIVLGAIGLWLKNTPKIVDWMIPYILGFIGIILASLILQDVLQGIIQGILVTAVAVYGHNLVKQALDR